MKLLPGFKLFPSLKLGGVLSLMHGGAMLCVYFINIEWWAKTALIVGVLINLVETVTNYALLNSKHAIVEFGLGEEGIWWLRTKSNKVSAAVISYPLFMSHRLIIINFTEAKKRLTTALPIYHDALAAEDFRKLKVVLKTPATS